MNKRIDGMLTINRTIKNGNPNLWREEACEVKK